MKVGLIVMLLVLVAGLGYTLTRIWQILPFTNTIKGLLFVIPFMAIASIIIYGSGVIDKLPLNFASFVYELGTSWPMILLYLWRIRYSQISSHSARNLFAKEHHWLGKYLYFRHCFVCLWQHQLQEKGENAYHFNHTKAAS